MERQALGARLLLPAAVRSAPTADGGLRRRAGRDACGLRTVGESVAVVGQGLRPLAAELVQRPAERGGRHRAGHRLRAAVRADHLDAAVLHREAQAGIGHLQVVLPLNRSADAHQQLGGLNSIVASGENF